MRKILLFVASAAAASTALASTEAHALGPLSIEVGATGGMGTNPDGNAPYNVLGWNVGGRAGVSIFSIYGGVAAEYFFGSSGDGVSAHTVKEGAQLGYNLSIPFLTIRPQVGLGNVTVTRSGTQTSTGIAMNGDSGSFYFEPGAVALLTLGMYFIGADANALIITGFKDNNMNTSVKTSFTWHGQLGVTF